MMWLLLPITDWPIISIGLGGLLLVVSNLFALLVLWVSLEGKND